MNEQTEKPCETCNDKIPDFCSNPRHFEPDEKPASEFTKECRELRRKGATSEQWEYASRMMEACGRLDAAEAENKELRKRLYLTETFQGPHEDLSDCPTFYDGCHCTVETLMHNIKRVDAAEAEKDKMQDRYELNIDILNERIKGLQELNETVQLNCNPPDDCNDSEVLKKYMKACFDKAMDAESNKKCEWKHSTGYTPDEPDDTNIWFTACDNVFEFTEAGIKENNFKYCPYCGGEISEKE